MKKPHRHLLWCPLNFFPSEGAKCRQKGLKTIVMTVVLGSLIIGCTARKQQQFLLKADQKSSEGHYQAAIELYKKTISVNPDSENALKALYRLGLLLENYLKDFDGALFSYEEYVRQSKDIVEVTEVQKRIAEIYFQYLQDYEKSIVSYRKLLSLQSSGQGGDYFQFKIAQCFFNQNKFDQSRIEFQILIEKYPKTHFASKARFGIANTFYLEEKYKVAIEAFKNVIRLHPQSEEAVESEFYLAQCWEHLSKFASAVQVYESLLKRYPSHKIIQMRLNELKKRSKQQGK